MRHISTHRRFQILATLLILTLFFLVSCATTGLGKSIQAADLQKKLVELSAVEFAKLHFRGDPRVTPAVYEQGKQAYAKWAAAQTAMASALATWQTVKSAPNEERLTTALTAVTASADLYLGLVARFVDLPALKSKVGG